MRKLRPYSQSEKKIGGKSPFFIRYVHISIQSKVPESVPNANIFAISVPYIECTFEQQKKYVQLKYWSQTIIGTRSEGQPLYSVVHISPMIIF